MDKNILKQKQEKRNEQNKAKQKQDFLKMQNECYLCGKNLNTHLEYLPKPYSVIEKAQCHNCMTMIRVKNHSLH